jgi:WD40 repeat protein
MRSLAIICLLLTSIALGCGGPAKKVAKKTKAPTTAAKKTPTKKGTPRAKQPVTGGVATNPAEGTPFLRPDQLQPGGSVDPTGAPRANPTVQSPPAAEIDPLTLIGKKDVLVARIDSSLLENPIVRSLSGDEPPLFFLLPPADVKFASAWIYISPTDKPPLEFATYLIFETAQERDRNLPSAPPEQLKTVDFEGKKYFKLEGGDAPSFCAIGERGIFSSSEARVREVLSTKGAASGKLAAAMKPVQGKGQAAAAVILSDARVMTEEILKELSLPPQLGQFLKGVDEGAVALDLRGKELLALHLRGTNSTQNEELQTNAKALLDVLGTLVGNLRVELGNESNTAAQKSILGLAEKLISSTAIEKQGELVHLSVSRPAELDKLPEMLAGGKKESEDAGKAKYPTYIAQAVQRGFVFPIADFLGAERKAKQPLLSWRVMLLSPLEQTPLLDLMNLDEPWDSEQNKKVLDKMPVYFETPYAPEKGTTTWKLLPDRNGGVILVEGGPGSAVPWTKPDQVPFDPEKPLEQFGEEPPGGYRVILTGSWDPVRLSAAELKAKLKAVMKHQAGSLAIDLEGKLLASGGLDNHVKLWDLSIGKELANLEGHTDSVHAVAFSKDSKLLASGSWDKTIRIWDVATRKHKMTLEGHELDVQGVVFFPDGKRLASAGRDDTVRIWNLETGKNIETIKCDESMYGVAISSDGRYLAASGLNGALLLWDLKKGYTATPLKGFKENVYCVAFSPDGKTLYSGGAEGIKVWKTADGSSQGTFGEVKDVETIALDRSGTILLTGEDHGAQGVKLWNVASGAHVVTFKYGNSKAVIHPDGKLVYTMVNSIIQPWTLDDKVTEEDK